MRAGDQVTHTPLPTTHVTATGITIRRLTRDDRSAIARLAQRDSSKVPSEPLLGAEVDGHLLAAISTAGGEVIADPFRPTAAIVDMLRVRAHQIDSQPPPPRRRGLRSLFRPPGRRANGSLSPSPPGAGGRVLTLAQRPGR